MKHSVILIFVFQVQPVTRKKLQLVGVTAMLVACKYEEMYVPMVGDFAYIADDAFTKAQIREMEMLILSELNFKLGRPLPLHFLRRASKAGNVSRPVLNVVVQGCCFSASGLKSSNHSVLSRRMQKSIPFQNISLN